MGCCPMMGAVEARRTSGRCQSVAKLMERDDWLVYFVTYGRQEPTTKQDNRRVVLQRKLRGVPVMYEWIYWQLQAFHPPGV